MKRLMIINWRWKGLTDNSSINIEMADKEKCLFISKYVKDNIVNFNNFINETITKDNPNEALILSHNNPASEISIPTNHITLISKENFLMKIREFKGGEERIYYGDINQDGMIDMDKNYLLYEQELKKENFNFVWDWYWNKLDLEYQKKNIINLWLPLAIDIQGLSEVQNDKTKVEKYFQEIKNEIEYLKSLKSFPNDDEFPRWKEIKQALNNNEKTKSYSDFNPKSIVEMLLSEETTLDSFKRSEAKYLGKEKDSNPNPNFLPNWLQEVVKVIDDKIKESSQHT